MKYLEKINNINSLVEEIKGKVDLGTINGSVYVESNYFKDSFELGDEPLVFYVVSDNLDSWKSHSLELELNSISMDYLFNVVDSTIFRNNFEDDTTKIV